MVRFLFLLFIAALGVAGGAQQLDREARATREITRYVEDWARNIPRSRRRALRHVISVAHWSVQYSVDPLLVAVIVSLESTWNPGATGKAGEIGLMQVHAPEAKRGFDLNDPDEQVHAGVRWLRVCIDTCGGNVVDGLNNYATGRCRPHWNMLAYRLKRWKRAVKLFRLIPATTPSYGLNDPPL